MKEVPKDAIKVGCWQLVSCCIECDTILTDHEEFYSIGMCPYCGFKHPSAATTVYCSEKSRRWITTKEYTWWRFKPSEGYWQYRK